MKREHLVRIKLRTNNIWDIESRVKEVSKIRNWVEKQCDWDPDNFEIKIHSMGNTMDIWFEDEKHATICALRWT